MKIKKQLLLTHGILVILSILIVLINVLSYKGMESDSILVNHAGKLRALSYNMVQLTNKINNSENQDSIRILKANLKLKIEEFDSTLLFLIEGNQQSIKGIKHKETLIKLEKIKKKWNKEFKPSYSKVIENESINLVYLQINEGIDLYVYDINEMVTSYSAYSSRKIKKAILVNRGLLVLIIGVTVYSFKSSNNKIRKPMEALAYELKELLSTDDEFVKKLENINLSEISEMSEYFNEMLYDQLTGTFNRKSGMLKLIKMLKGGKDIQLKLSLCFVDINGLKTVNDQFGHEAGDELIVTAAKVIKQEVRDDDFIIRMGGDEFLIVLKGIDQDTAELVWQRIKNQYQAINEEEERPYVISLSHGIVECDNCQNPDIDLLIRQADEKMYIEKRHIKDVLKLKIIKSEEKES